MMHLPALVLGIVLMLAGPLLQGLAGNSDPYAYVFAPVMLAGAIPLIAGLVAALRGTRRSRWSPGISSPSRIISPPAPAATRSTRPRTPSPLRP